MTIKLYDQDSHLAEFDAVVLSCTPQSKRYAVRLDRTAFFPEEGGQPADTGTLGGVRVLEVQETPEGILHYTDGPLREGESVHGSLDWLQRFRRMQNHSGEHVVSGLICGTYGYRNVGFHLTDGEVVVDFNGELTRAQLDEIEDRANAVVTANLPVTAEYPPEETLRTLDYRSKLDLTENVRIVTIPGVDVCACCAPHVQSTGEIGCIKLLDFMRHRGGVRIRMLCGAWALADYRNKCENAAAISALLSARQEKIAEAVERMNRELQQTKLALSQAKKQLLSHRLAQMSPKEGNLLLFEEDGDSNYLRDLADGGADKCTGVCGGFSGTDQAGYRYVLISRTADLRALAKDFNAAVNGRGGGTKEMIQGSAKCTRAELERYFASLKKR